MGEFFVIAFFGLGAVGGTFRVAAHGLGVPPLLARLALGLFAAMMIAPFLILALLIALTPHRALWLAFGALPMALIGRCRIYAEPSGPGLNALPARMARVQALHALLLGFGARVRNAG